MMTKNFIRTTGLIWWAVAIIITVFLIFFEGIRFYDYLGNRYFESNMRIVKIKFHSDSGERNVVDVEGKIDNKNVYFSMYDEDIKYVREHIKKINNDTLAKVSYNQMYRINVFFPVVKFDNSKNVILIPKNSSKRVAINKWLVPKIILFLIAYIPLLIFNNKYFKKCIKYQ